MKKFAVTSLVFCISIALLFSSTIAKAQDDTVFVHPLYWDESNVIYSDQIIVLRYGWAACRHGAVQMFLTAVDQYWEINGEPLFSPNEDPNQYWGEITAYPIDPSNSSCMGKPQDYGYRTSWRYTLGTLAAGEYEIYFDWWLNHPVTDVADYDGDGRPDLFYDLGENTIVVTVEDR